MSERAIDYNRGVIKRDCPDTGVEVYMYRDQPGVFLNAFGVEVSAKVAAAAGFDVEKLTKEKLKSERMAEAMKTIEAELDLQPAAQAKVLETRSGFQMVDMGLGRVHVRDEDGNVLTPLPVPEAVGKVLLEQLAPTPPKEPTEAAKDIDVGPELGGKDQTKPKSKQKETKDADAT